MADFIDFLNKNTGALSLLFSAVVMVATVIYALLTAKLVDETRRLRQVQTEPRVQVGYRTSEHWINFLDIVIKNIGLGPAHDLKFHVRPLSQGPGAVQLTDSLQGLSSFSKGLAYLGPGEVFTSFWTSLVEGDPSKMDSQLEVVCHYKNSVGVSYSHTQLLDLTELKGISRLGEPAIQSIAKHLDEIKKDIHWLTTGFRRLPVDVFSKDDRDAERAAREEDRGEQQGVAKNEP